MHQSVDIARPLEEVDRRAPPASARLTGRLQRPTGGGCIPLAAATPLSLPIAVTVPTCEHYRQLSGTCPVAVSSHFMQRAEGPAEVTGSRTGVDFRCHRPSTADTIRPPPLGDTAPFTSKAIRPTPSSERQRTTAAMAAATATPPSPQAAAMRQPSDTRPSAADTRPDWPPGSRPRKWSTTEGPVSVDRRSSPGVRGKAALVRPGGRRCRSCWTPPASGRSADTDSPPHGPARTAWFLLPERRTVNPLMFRLVTTFLTFLKAGPAGGRLRGRPRPARRPEPGNRPRPFIQSRAAAAPGQATSRSPPEQVHAMPSQAQPPVCPVGVG